MTITRIWQAGCETGDLSEFDVINFDFTISSGTFYTGYYSFADTGKDNRYGQKTIPATRQIRLGFYCFDGTNPVGSNRLDILDGSSNTLVSLLFDSGNEVSLLVGGINRDSDFLQTGDWKHYSLDIYIDSTSGWVKVYVDGSEKLSYTGNTGNSDIRYIKFGKLDSVGITDNFFYDDIYIDDTTGESSPSAPPIKRFYPLNVNGDGNYSQWTIKPSGTNHYEMVDERPPDNDTTYLEAVTGSLLDSFDMTTFILDNNQNIIAMIPFVIAKRGSTTEQLSLGTRSSGTNLIGNAQDLSTSYNYMWERQVTGSLGFDWNQSYLDSVEVIINSTGTY